MVTAYEQSLITTKNCIKISMMSGTDVLKWNENTKRVEVDDSKSAKGIFFALSALILYLFVDVRPDIKKTSKLELEWSTVLKVFEFIGTTFFHVFLVTFMYKSRHARSKLSENMFKFDLDMERVYKIRYAHSNFEKQVFSYVKIYAVVVMLLFCSLVMFYVEDVFRKASIIKSFPTLFGAVFWLSCVINGHRIVDRIRFLGMQFNYDVDEYKEHGTTCRYNQGVRNVRYLCTRHKLLCLRSILESNILLYQKDFLANTYIIFFGIALMLLRANLLLDCLYFLEIGFRGRKIIQGDFVLYVLETIVVSFTLILNTNIATQFSTAVDTLARRLHRLYLMDVRKTDIRREVILFSRWLSSVDTSFWIYDIIKIDNSHFMHTVMVNLQFAAIMVTLDVTLKD